MVLLCLEEAVIQLPGRKTFTVKAPRKEDNEVYICSMKLNGGKIYEELYYSSGYHEGRNIGVCYDCLTRKMITNGEVLEFVPGKISKMLK